MRAHQKIEMVGADASEAFIQRVCDAFAKFMAAFHEMAIVGHHGSAEIRRRELIVLTGKLSQIVARLFREIVLDEIFNALHDGGLLVGG